MRLLFIRHAEPDYENNCLTEKGRREAQYLADYLCGRELTYIYTSPYGRAKETASYTLEKLGLEAEELPWLKEFDKKIRRPDDRFLKHIAWDWLPQDWTKDPRMYDRDHWSENERMAASEIGEEYRQVTECFDALLAKHGYVREGEYYRAERPNHDTIALFCHFGVESVMLSHLWGTSPAVVWHNTCAQASSVTTLVTEERRRGIALFRMLAFGETTHLYINDEEPSFKARFCECFEDDTIHD